MPTVRAPWKTFQEEKGEDRGRLVDPSGGQETVKGLNWPALERPSDSLSCVGDRKSPLFLVSLCLSFVSILVVVPAL